MTGRSDHPVQLRAYQQEAVARVLSYFRRDSRPGCLVLPTGAGKSLVIASLAQKAKGRVLVLAHVKELCEQNHHKYSAYGPAGLFSAGLGQHEARLSVTFGSIQSVARHLDAFNEPISLLVIDECHRVSGEDGSQYQEVIRYFQAQNPKLKLLGLTATPYRLDSGWCYEHHLQQRVARTAGTRPFHACIYEVTLQQLIEQGYLTRPTLRAPQSWAALLAARAAETPWTVGDIPAGGCGTSSAGTPARDGDALLADARMTEAHSADGDALLAVAASTGALESPLSAEQRRASEVVIDDVVSIAQIEDRRGVMIFASGTQHAHQIFALLPQGQAALILGETPDEERSRQIRDFCEGKRRYLVNVSVLTTGFDAPHVDFIALLRKTESVSLFQQMVGRGLRLAPGKTDCLVIDYAKNGFDLYAPEVGEPQPHPEAELVSVECPACGHDNRFWGTTDEQGRAVTHYGRRCHALLPSGQQCDYRFVFKECPRCTGENDIAARSCNSCAHRLVDPDEMLKNALLQKDTLVLRVSGVAYEATGSVLRLTYHDEDGANVSERFDLDHAGQRAAFNRVFGRRIAGGRRPLELQTSDQALLLQAHLPRPDFVIARRIRGKRRGHTYFRVEQRLFDYQGPRRTAAAAS